MKSTPKAASWEKTRARGGRSSLKLASVCRENKAAAGSGQSVCHLCLLDLGVTQNGAVIASGLGSEMKAKNIHQLVAI